MIFKSAVSITLLALMGAPPAQAREAALMRFDQSVAPSGTVSVSEDRVGTALRFHLQSIAQPTGQAELKVLNGAACSFEGYAPAWWLPPKVEMRRSAYFSSMASIACEFGVPIPLLDAVIAQESGYNPLAVSDAGAMGMMQVMPGTARSLGLIAPFDAIANMRAGARYLRQQIERFGRIDLALAAYNAGPERRSLAVGYVPAIPETVNYVKTISRNWARLAATPPANDLHAERAIAASNAVLAAGYRGVELLRYDGINAANPI